MKLCISHMSAFRWYMRNPLLRSASARSSKLDFRVPVAAELTLVQDMFQKLTPELLSNRPEPLSNRCEPQPAIDILVEELTQRCMRPGVKVHVVQKALPAHSFLRMGTLGRAELYIVSPELLFLQLGEQLPVEEAVYCGMALCSNYVLAPGAEGGIALRSDSGGPLTTSTALSRYLGQCEGMRGSKKARTALNYVLDNSYSPMETGIAMMFRLPACRGGFGYKDVVLNQEVSLRVADGARRTTATRKPDILISAAANGQHQRVGIDYDSTSFHAAQTRIRKDAVRRNELAALGSLTYFTLTKNQALEFGSFCMFAEQVRQALGVRATPRLRMSRSSKEGLAKLEAVQHARFQLWAKVVCPSNFRKMM